MVGTLEPFAVLYVCLWECVAQRESVRVPASLLAPSLSYGLYSWHLLLTETFVQPRENCILSSTHTHSIFRSWCVDSGLQEGSDDV